MTHSNTRGINLCERFLSNARCDSFPPAWDKLLEKKEIYSIYRLIPTYVG